MATILPPRAGQPNVLIEAAAGETILDLDPATIEALFKRHGALLFRGFGADAGAFRRFAWQFCETAVFNESPGRQPIEPEHNIHTVDGGVREFALHPELSREPWKPDAAFFCCLSAPSVGGETTICDGVELVQALPEPVRRGLAGRRLIYIKPTWPELLAYWLGTPDPDDAQLSARARPGCPYSFHRVHGEVVRVFSRPALHRPMFVDAPAFGNFLLFARFNNNVANFPVLDDGHPVPEEWLQAIRATGERLKVAVQWRPGDVVMLDNTRFMHGRNAIIDPGERLIATFFGYLKFARPDVEEPDDAPWRRPGFAPPLPPQLAGRL
ncbi:TauD/TfdA family dioxygenase [Sphingomonas sp.]|uniref:TauD/TfdA family dioxygenase n=1 Tax=Sphingomonas sp. TaxID=28214 RepID=UPI0025FA6980|nr:TauD/TfdA family dioxygenase [Sphingomonas sp.]